MGQFWARFWTKTGCFNQKTELEILLTLRDHNLTIMHEVKGDPEVKVSTLLQIEFPEFQCVLDNLPC